MAELVNTSGDRSEDEVSDTHRDPLAQAGDDVIQCSDQVALKGVVKTRQGMLALVENAAKKSYVLREKDPVFNGYVVKITGDSIVFQETMQDRLGKSFTREVTKKITTPAV